MKVLKFSMLIFALLATGCAVTTNRLHPNLVEELKQVEKIVIAPPDVSINLIKFKGDNERISEEEERYKQVIVKFAEEKLVQSGFTVVDFDFKNAIDEDSEFAYLVNQVKEDFEVAKKDLKAGLSISENEAKKLQSKVGEAVNQVSNKTGADAILLIRYEGFKKSEGQIAKDIGTSVLVGVLTLGSVVPVQPASGALAEVAMIDGTTGEVLWTDVKQGTLSELVARSTLTTLPLDVDAPLADSVEGIDKN